ncbi:DUF2231 domain-containing protein [Nocardioides cheoyonin]|uniref:DUF2231 domain-containing protein n=1 Tax=Nocardioides cheoyonin TaxID=3156615 RepID=UPI0032B577EB
MNVFVRSALRVESVELLDGVDRAVRPAAELLIRTPRARGILHGHWLGHGIHPPMTDFPLGMWFSGTLLDLTAGPDLRPAARRLIGMGAITALPTALTGIAEWASIDEQRDRRTGLVHAAVNSSALSLYALSWLARRSDRHLTGTILAVGGGLAATAGGFFGGHLSEVRKISSRHPAFGAD